MNRPLGDIIADVKMLEKDSRNDNAYVHEYLTVDDLADIIGVLEYAEAITRHLVKTYDTCFVTKIPCRHCKHRDTNGECTATKYVCKQTAAEAEELIFDYWREYEYKGKNIT